MLRKWVIFPLLFFRIQIASMRPEHGCSGNEDWHHQDSTENEASMRPEHGCSGNVDKGDVLLFAGDALQ